MVKKLTLVFVGALLIRIILIPVAFHGDLYNNLSWGNALVKYGPVNYYERTVWDHSAPNQPPLYILVFGASMWVEQSIGRIIAYLNSNVGIFPSSMVWFWQNNGKIILLKLPSIIADLGIGWVIYLISRKEKLTYLWLFNPLTFYNSSIWGQTDSIVNLLGLISIYFLLKKRLIPSVLFIVASLLFKGSLTIFLPVLIIVWILQKHGIKDWLKAFGYSLLLVAAVSVWFHPQIDLPIWLYNLYTQRFFPGEIGYLTANAFNVWYLVNPGKVLDSVRYFGMSAHLIGYLAFVASMGLIILRKRKSLMEERTILMFLAMSALASFLFFTRIHERYLYPFFPVATLLVGLIPELTFPYIVLSLTFLVNMYNLFWAPGIELIRKMLETTFLPAGLALVNVLIFTVLFFWVMKQKRYT